MSRVFNIALEKHTDATDKAIKKGEAHAKRIAEAVLSATKDNIKVESVVNQGGTVRVRLLVRDPDSKTGWHKTVGYEIKV